MEYPPHNSSLLELLLYRTQPIWPLCSGIPMAKASTLQIVLIPARLNDVWNPVCDAAVKSVLPTL